MTDTFSNLLFGCYWERIEIIEIVGQEFYSSIKRKMQSEFSNSILQFEVIGRHPKALKYVLHPLCQTQTSLFLVFYGHRCSSCITELVQSMPVIIHVCLINKIFPLAVSINGNACKLCMLSRCFLVFSCLDFSLKKKKKKTK